MWDVHRTDTFLQTLKEHKKNAALLAVLDKKILRLIKDPHAVGGELSGKLHGWRSTRLVRKYRLLFKIDETAHRVTLGAIDHRESAYG
ncbi:hypothetical protein CMO91_05290 [Candidatus Woesearchaeota archaeon]|jgi:mRNA-degrading endonuclease RelE of RelBE toxin-antitoxin system|nr:hypothetical protein [Candidatus Woesearchaeota archaeon]|tara:strand:- start:68 stop:331 length:264 start_codon:yes stop_codon:yes gene_type:complete